jgi:hypothetical protein
MSFFGSHTGRALIAAALTLAGATAAEALDPRLRPIRAHGELLARQIYDVTRWSVRVPYELAFPYLVRFKLDSYLDGLPLEDDVRRRVEAHVASRTFVDEVVPFLIAVQETYSVSAAARADDFDAHLRRRFSPADRIPGIEHSMFQWRPPKTEAGGGVGVDAALAARLVTIYDALYLRDRDGDLRLGERLACSQPASDAQLESLNRRLQPLVRDLLEDLARRFADQPEIAGAASGVARDPERLDAVTISLVDVINFEVCKHYRVFATRVYREDQLRRWMLAELARPDGGDLWSFLEDAGERRRYAVQVVVDGLQGRLVESLARGDAADPFLRAIAAEHAGADAARPRAQPSRPAPAQQTRFLEHLTRHGLHHPDYLPYFRRLRGERGIARVGISTTPTISVRNVPIALTGAPVAGPVGTGLPNFHYVDRGFRRDGVQQGRAYYFYGNDAALLEELTRRAGMRTLVERLPWLSSFNCAAQYDAGAHFTVDGFVNLGVGEKWRDFGETLCLPELERRARNESQLRGLRRRLLEKRHTIEAEPRWYEWYERLGQVSERELARRLIDRIAALEQETLPELLVYYNPWPDHFAHFEGPFSDEILSPSGELNRLDFWLGRIAAVYDGAGLSARTLFVMAGDHGLAPVFHVLNPEVEVFDRLRARGLDVRVVKISSDEGEGPKLTHRLRPPSMRGWDAVVASTAGGNYMIDFFVDQEAGWSRQPLHADLLRLRLISGQGPVNAVEEIYAALSESLDYLVVRETPCGAGGGTVRVVGERGGRRAEAWIERRGRRVFYRFAGADLLGTAQPARYEHLGDAERAEHARLYQRCVEEARADDEATWCDETQWRLLTSYTDRPDSVVQLAHLYDVNIAGTVNLFPRAGIGYNTLVPGRHAGESFHEKDAFAGAWGAPVRSGPRLRTAVIGSMPMLAYEYLAGVEVEDGDDGWGYPSLARELLSTAGAD